MHFDHKTSDMEWEDEQYLLCPPRVLGYILQDKQWAQLQVTHLKDIPHNDTEDAWSSRLKLANKETKDLLFDLVRTHTTPAKGLRDKYDALEVDDIVPGKGKGLVGFKRMSERIRQLIVD